MTAIVAVTGGEPDNVNDVIVPGAFKRTLRVRQPKVVHHHEWRSYTGRVLHVEELLPGDRRLPKRQSNGDPWPPLCGALVATMQMNMATEAGRDAWEWARFFGAEGAWSIGYKVVDGKAARGKDGVRYIYDLHLYEISDVLHGAHDKTMTLEVKSAPASMEHKQSQGGPCPPAATAVMEAKALGQGPGPDGGDEKVKVAGLAVVARDTGRVLMLQRANDPRDRARGMWEFPGGHLEGDETPMQGAIREWQEETGATLPTGDLTGTWDSPNGIYRGHVYAVDAEDEVDINTGREDRRVLNPDDPDGDDAEVAAWWRPETLPDMPALRRECRKTDWAVIKAGGKSKPERPSRAPMEAKTAAEVVGSATRAFADVEFKYDTSPLGEPGNRENWVDQVGGLPPYVRAIAHALQREGHSESAAIRMAVGTVKRWARGGDDVTAKTRAKAAKAVAAWERMKIQSHADNAEKKAAPPHEVETKAMHQPMTGSYEQRRTLLGQAVRELFCKPTDSDGDGDGHGGYVSVEATYDSHAIVTYRKGEDTTSYSVPYTFDGNDVALGAPTEVDLSVVAVPVQGEAPEEADEAEAAEARYMGPAAGHLGDAVALLAMAPEGKSMDELRPAVLGLLDTLAVKGMNVDDLVGVSDDGEESLEGKAARPVEEQPYNGEDGDGEDEPDPDDEPDPEVDPAEPEPDGDPDDGDSGGGEGTVSLSPDEVRAQLDSIRPAPARDDTDDTDDDKK